LLKQHVSTCHDDYRAVPRALIDTVISLIDECKDLNDQLAEVKAMLNEKPITYKSDGGNGGSTEFNIVDCSDPDGECIVGYFDCPDCGGDGRIDGPPEHTFKTYSEECETCNGTGKIPKADDDVKSKPIKKKLTIADIIEICATTYMHFGYKREIIKEIILSKSDYSNLSPYMCGGPLFECPKISGIRVGIDSDLKEGEFEIINQTFNR